MINLIPLLNHSYPTKNGIIIACSERSLSDWDKLYQTSVAGNTTENLTQHAEFEEFLITSGTAPRYLPALAMFDTDRPFTCLEVGCGIGTFSLQLKSFYPKSEVILLDRSRQALSIAQALFTRFNQKATFVYADAADLPFKNQRIDYIYSGGLLEHFQGEKQKKIASEQIRVAGQIICQVPVATPAYWILRELITLRNGFRWPFGFEKPLTDQAIIHLFSPAKLKKTASHDLLTAWTIRMRRQNPGRKTALNQLFKTDGIYLFNNSSR